MGKTFAEMVTKSEIEQEISSARMAFGHIEGIDDLGCLNLTISQLKRMSKERLAALNATTQRVRDLEIRLSKKRLITDIAAGAVQGMLAHPNRYKPLDYNSVLHWHEAIASEAFDIAEAMAHEAAKRQPS